LKDELRASVNEMKSMSETNKILKDDHKYVSATKCVSMLDSACDGISKLSSYQCCNCIQLESQLKETLNELRSVKLIVEILNDEIKFLKQISPTDSYADPSWATAKMSNSCARTTLRPSKGKHTMSVKLHLQLGLQFL
jgi:hypothetical protein